MINLLFLEIVLLITFIFLLTYFLIEEKEGWASLFFIFTCFTIFSTVVTLKILKDNIEKPKVYIYEYNK